jgi:hypothetical protein
VFSFEQTAQISDDERTLLLIKFGRRLVRRGDRLICRIGKYRYSVWPCPEEGKPKVYAGEMQNLKKWPRPFPQRPPLPLPGCYPTAQEAVDALFDMATRTDYRFIEELRRLTA